MFQRFHELREREGGFTLIELLVVILIVAILAAVAIPIFLRQREKGYRDQMESALKNAATSVESYATEANGDYSGMNGAAVGEDGAETAGAGGGPASADPSLTGQGFSPTVNAGVTVGSDATTFCIDATHALTDDTFFYDSGVGAPQEGTCPA